VTDVAARGALEADVEERVRFVITGMSDVFVHWGERASAALYPYV
jgi:hypothetical protein